MNTTVIDNIAGAEICQSARFYFSPYPVENRWILGGMDLQISASSTAYLRVGVDTVENMLIVHRNIIRGKCTVTFLRERTRHH